jgi:hypothetical protein
LSSSGPPRTRSIVDYFDAFAILVNMLLQDVGEVNALVPLVEGTLAWLGRCRRLAKDWECLNRMALAFLHLASIRLMFRKLCNPA